MSNPADYLIRFTPDAAQDVKSLDGSIKKKLQKALEKKLAINPEGYGVPLRGPLAGFWKHKFGSHRIIYRISPEPKAVIVCAVGARRGEDATDVYKQFEKAAAAGKVAEKIAAVLRLLSHQREVLITKAA
ncbi:MAG: type II toxin-antitoxin system RelE/ParE family toxin [Candidatus Acidiferrum sp.]